MEKKRRPLTRVKAQWTLLLLLFTLVTAFVTGWILYTQVSSQVIRDAWQQHESLLESACTALNREIGEMRSFTWQLNNHAGVTRYLHLKTQTPGDILVKKDMIDLLQEMKAFSNTLCDIGLYAEGVDLVITAESSYPSADYFSRVEGVTLEEILRVRSRPGSIALCAFAGKAVLNRLISRETVLTFISSLPMNRVQGKSFAFFHLPEERLRSCLPDSGSGRLLLCDGTGQVLTEGAEEAFRSAARLYMENPGSRIRLEGADYGVSARKTAAEGLYCMAIVPYQALLAPAERVRRTVMLVMSLCMAVGLVGAVLVSKRLYSPLERLLESARQLVHGLPEGGRANEYKLLEDVLHMISAQNHALTLNNREIRRLLKNRLLSDWMEGRLRTDGAESLEKVGVQLSYDRVQIAVAEINPRDLEDLKLKSGLCAADRVEDLATGQDLGRMKVYCAERTDGRLLVLFNQDARHPLPETIYTFLRQCRQEVFGGFSCAIGVGRAYSAGRASESLVDALLALKGSVGDKEMCLAEEIPDVPDTEYPIESEQRLINQMLSGRREEVESTLRTLLAAGDGDPVPRAGLVRALLFTAGRAARQAGTEEAFARVLVREGFREEELPAEQDAGERLKRVFLSVMEGVNASASTQEEKQYQRLTAYIGREYGHDISLDSVGEALSMSPSYIGLVFRHVGGTSFLKYLTDVRMEEVRRLLVTTDLTLREIGERVGIENQNTLIRTFKKAEGVTPGQYRMAKTAMHSQNG